MSSGLMSILYISDHCLATSIRLLSSFVCVAIYAPHLEQSNPQQAIIFYPFYHLFLKTLNIINTKPITKNIPPIIIIITGFKSGLNIRKTEDIIIKIFSNLIFIFISSYTAGYIQEYYYPD